MAQTLHDLNEQLFGNLYLHCAQQSNSGSIVYDSLSKD